IVGSTRDISERIATEKRLFKSEEQFQQTFVNASVGMIIVDKNGSIINANQAFLKMLDYDQNDIKKPRWPILFCRLVIMRIFYKNY
ncbi:MAG TPA: PAS domain S-box protein, partial [bacterium]|nr:PAS domain S-box protein [bacterium]